MGEKVFRDTRIQIGILKSRGIIIKNKKWAKQVLRQINYYNLINGYKEPFIKPGCINESYIDGTKFEEIYALYEFDRRLRLVILEAILEIEKQIKSIISYTFSKEHGHKDYLNYSNFNASDANKHKQVSRLFCSIHSKIFNNIDNDASVAHYVGDKNYIPLWVLVNTISMGDISKFYSNMLQSDREEVAKRFKWGIRENQLSSCLFYLSAVRNRCAHDERLYSYLSKANLYANNYFKYFKIAKETNNLFAAMVALKMTLSNKRYISFQNEVEKLLNDLSSKLTTIPIKKIREYMGFPNNWKNLGKL